MTENPGRNASDNRSRRKRQRRAQQERVFVLVLVFVQPDKGHEAAVGQSFARILTKRPGGTFAASSRQA